MTIAPAEYDDSTGKLTLRKLREGGDPNGEGSARERAASWFRSAPSFLELVTRNCAGELQRIVAYAEIYRLLSCTQDYDGYIVAGDKLLNEARSFAAYLKLLKRPSILSQEAADRREEEASRCRERAELLELEALQIRAALL